mmetsp:Transcript_18806/g.39475  ORF Transcript_18806/g.39475 Transcript_18806/m.39475 type:complete len:339 (+) Transcript_18806:772-1788(+)
MAAASSFDSITISNANNNANNNSNDSIDKTTMAASDGRSVYSVAVAFSETVPSNDATSQRSVGSRPTPLPSNNNSSRSNPRRRPTATSTSSPRRRKKNAVVKNCAAKSFKKQPLGKMWIRHVPIAFKPCSNYYQSRDNSRKDEQPSLLHHQNHYQQPREGDSTDSYLSTVFLLSSPTNDHGSSTFHSPHPPANSHSFQQPQSQPKYFYRRPHSLRSSITTVHAFGESGKPLSTSLTSSSSHSSSPKSAPIASPSNHATLPLRTDPSYSCYNHHNMHEDSLVHSSFSGYSSKHGVFALETNGHGDHHANANVNADDGGYYDNYVFPEKDAAPVVKLMGC